MPAQTTFQIGTYTPAPVTRPRPTEYRVFAVLRASYSKLVKRGALSLLCITYHCDERAIAEVVCIEHRGLMQKSANWWQQRTNIAMPRTVDDVLNISSCLRVPVRIAVSNLNRKYPVIVEYMFRTIN
jgi:hypothetical protein